MPEIYRSPYSSSIADLMRQSGSVSARSALAKGDAEAQRAMVSGQAWGNAIQNIGQGVSGTLRDFAQQQEQAPRMALMQRQADQLAQELSAMEAAQAQKKIGELAAMVKASGYDPNTAEPVFRAIGKLSPDYEQPLMRSLMEPNLLKQVTDTLISQTPGYKAPEGFTLGPEQVRFGGEGQEIARGPAKPEPVPQPYTLTPGSQRRGANNEVLAEVPANTPNAPNPTEASLAMQAAGGDPVKALQMIRAQRPASASGPRPLTQTAEAAIINRLSQQWTAANKPMKELERQVQLMDAGMEAVKRGDMAQGSQAVLVTFQKILDPPSVVRESEYARSASGLSLQERVRGAYQRLVAGGAGVSPEELQKFATLAREAATAQRNASGIDSIKKRLGLTADRYGIPTELIFEGGDSTPEPSATEEWVRDANGRLVRKGGG